jgi:N-formylglutamate amidohydrolase
LYCTIELGPEYGYFPEPRKSILVVKEHNKRAAEVYFEDLGFTIVTRTRYLGGFVGKELDQKDWIVKQAKNWNDAVGKLTYVAEKHPQPAYAGLQRFLGHRVSPILEDNWLVFP